MEQQLINDFPALTLADICLAISEGELSVEIDQEAHYKIERTELIRFVSRRLDRQSSASDSAIVH